MLLKLKSAKRLKKCFAPIFQELKEVSNAECSLMKRFAAKGLRSNAQIMSASSVINRTDSRTIQNALCANYR
jgi:hypothetical protein